MEEDGGWETGREKKVENGRGKKELEDGREKLRRRD